ncbi:MAG: hypothetical protein IJJ33_08665 [Victivallales bacterium]|nr:hypothetical protein [Victivallales bacterium]
MSWIDWLITIVPLCVVMWLGFYVRRYITGVSDFLACGRLCHRYVLLNQGLANSLGLITLVSYIEVHYKTGFALAFWSSLTLPISIALSLLGIGTYRFRETRALSIGQFLEMRYSRSLRIFASFLRSIAEMLANMIMPAVAARFFIAYLGLPQTLVLGPLKIPTFLLIIIFTLVLAITLICTAGQLSITITDTLQALLFLPVVLIFIIFVLTKFSWSNEIVQVMADRAPGESFINPYDLSKLRDFNWFMLITTWVGLGLHRISGITGNSGGAAVTAHEGKMANLLGTWRGAFDTIFYVCIAVAIITVLHHQNFAAKAKEIRTSISQVIAEEKIQDPAERAQFMEKMSSIPEQRHVIGQDAPFSEKTSPDQVYFDKAQEYFGLDGQGSKRTQEFKTLFRQMMLPVTMRHLLPKGLVGLFCMLILLFILSTDDSRIYSASSTLVQDCVVPFYKEGQLSPEKHVFWIRLISIGVGVFFVFGSVFMSQLDYISLFVSITYGMWMGGCGPMLMFGLYSRFGTTAGAWCSLLLGMCINLSGAICQRCWASFIYPLLEDHGLVDRVGAILTTLSKPFHPYVVWEMNRLKFPINSYEVYLIAMLSSLVVYIVVSLLTKKEPFNLERMLHRGKYATEGAKNITSAWTWKTVWQKLIGITPEYSRSDKAIAWAVFGYSFVYKFIIMFILVVIVNAFMPWGSKGWGNYFFVANLAVPGVAAVLTAIWFGIGGIRDLRRMFHDLANRTSNPLDNGMVSGHVSLDEKEKIAAIEKAATEQSDDKADNQPGMK